MQAKYIGDISKGSKIELVEIDSYHGKSFEEKLRLAEHMVSIKKNLRLFDDKKEMIGDYPVDEKTAAVFLNEKQEQLIAKEQELNERDEVQNEREKNLDEREAQLNELEKSLSNTEVKKKM